MNVNEFAVDAFALSYITDVAIEKDFDSATKIKLLKIAEKMETMDPDLVLNYKNINGILDYYMEKYEVK